MRLAYWTKPSRDRTWLLVLVASFVFGLAVSWLRWGNPLIDTGREMNQPLRLASGEMLYSDVRHVYGPLSPYLHAALFRLFGPSLAVLYADGILTAAVILALVYWLARHFMSPAAAAAATLSVMWLCVFKPAGNYILPYSFNALHGAALGLATLAIVIVALGRARDVSSGPFLFAGAAAGLTLLAKTEMGVAALAAGVTGAVLAARPDRARAVRFAASFLLTAAGVAAGVYALIAGRVGWSTLVADNWILLYNVPPELAAYNRWVSGFDNPVRSLMRMLIAAVKIGVAAAVVVAISIMAAGTARGREPWRLLAAALAVLVAMWMTIGLDPDKGPYLAMPFLLAGLLVAELARGIPHAGVTRTRRAILITCVVYALASLGRMILHVRSGGAYASYLLPVSVVLFTYLWVGPLAGRLRPVRARRLARAIAVALLVGNAAATAAILAYRYRTRNTAEIVTERGTMIAAPDVGQAWNEAIAYIGRHTRPGDPVAVLPEGTSLTFLSGRRNPLRDEIAIPGILDQAAESRAIRQLQETRTRLILITNRPTGEFGRAAFGRDYSQRLMRWIESNYTTCAIFGPVKDPRVQIGDAPFFIRAYCEPVPAPPRAE